MEPDVIRMYSSSPPPLDEGAEEDDDEFGDFGGFSGVPSSLGLNNFDTPVSFSQSRATDTVSPNHLSNGAAKFVAFGSQIPSRGVSCSPNGGSLQDPNSRHGFPWLGKAAAPEDVERPADPSQSCGALKPGRGRTDSQTHTCNGGSTLSEFLTNGFDEQESPSSQAAVDPKAVWMAADPTQGYRPAHKLPNAGLSWDDGQVTVTDARDCLSGSEDGDLQTETSPQNPTVGDAHGAGQDRSTEHGQSDNRVSGPGAEEPGSTHEHQQSATEDPLSRTWAESKGEGDWDGRVSSPGCEDEESDRTDAGGQNSEKGTDLEGPPLVPTRASTSASEDSVSLCRTPSPHWPEEFREDGMTGSFPSPSFPRRDHIEGDGAVRGSERPGSSSSDPTDPAAHSGFARLCAGPSRDSSDEEFGDFSSLADCSGEGEMEGEERGVGDGQLGAFPGSDSFADFSSAPVGDDPDPGWSASWGQGETAAGGDSWVAFGKEPSAACSEDSEEVWQDSPPVTAPPSCSPQSCRRGSLSGSLADRMERLFKASFPEVPVPEGQGAVVSLGALLEPEGRSQERRASARWEPRDVWQHLRDTHNALGLKYQWGGSHGNRTLLCSLGVDTRNVLHTGQRKQPVLVPVFAASLGVLEPTKEKLTSPSIALSPPPDSTKEALPSVQFDWSSSGLTNPLDGVDQELSELNAAKPDVSSASNRVTDAFTRLMSTMGKTSTSVRKPRKEENLSGEAARVIAGLPDLSFMQARMLMFPSTLTLPDSTRPH